MGNWVGQATQELACTLQGGSDEALPVNVEHTSVLKDRNSGASQDLSHDEAQQLFSFARKPWCPHKTIKDECCCTCCISMVTDLLSMFLWQTRNVYGHLALQQCSVSPSADLACVLLLCCCLPCQAVSCVTFSSCGSILISGSEDTLVQAWLLGELLDSQLDPHSAAAMRPAPLHSW